MALLIALSVITILITITLELHRQVRQDVIAAATARDHLTLSYMASSGVHGAMAMLLQDKTESEIDSLQEDWANQEKIAQVLQQIRFDEGELTVEIIDEMSKIQVNALVDFPAGRHFSGSQKIMWDRFAHLIFSQQDEFDQIEASEIINSVKDWLDSNDDDAITGLNGAESEYYQDLTPPYSCRNGPIPYLEELLKVRGMTTEIFHGGKEFPGVSQFLSVFGVSTAEGKRFTYEGRININTAELPVLLAMIPSENPEYAQSIHDYRQEKEGSQYLHDLSNPAWYKNAPGCSELKIDPKIIAVSSDCFKIISTATFKERKMQVQAVVVRKKDRKTGKWGCHIINWKKI